MCVFGFLSFTGKNTFYRVFARQPKILKINIDDEHERDKIELELGRNLTLRVAQSSKKITLSTGGTSVLFLIK